MTRSTLLAALLGLGASGLALPLAAPVAHAQEASALSAEALIEKVEARFREVESIQSRFTQIAKSDLFGDEKTTGDLLVARPAKLRWAFDDGKRFISDGQTMWIYSPEEKQAMAIDDVAGSAGGADSLLTSLDKLGEMFAIEVLASGAEGHALQLFPKEPGGFKSVRLELTGDLLPTKVVMTDAFDNVTEISLHDVKLDVPTKAEQFTFTAPAGVEIIQQN